MAALFGSRVRRLRTAAGLTQAELGEKTHVVSTRITQIERSSGAKPTLELARAPVAAPAVLPWQTCDGGCERAFRGAEPGRCRDCPPDNGVTTAGPASTHADRLQTAC
jgi:DNA-binding XRE family transcriptional regulator